MEKLMNFLENALSKSLILDGTIAQSSLQREQIWHFRERITLALSKNGEVYKYDFSLPVRHMYDLVEEVRNRVGENALVTGYGHMGDGNLHLNISVPTRTSEITNLLEPWVYEQTRKMNGSVSAEHGIGVLKKKYLPLNKTPEALAMMRHIKKVFDPQNILNPSKVFDV
jgi:D-2-hydroxyglutarate dehydrogenase